jgi:Fic family protein
MAASGAAGGGLWTLSRGLARKNEDYREYLSAADEKRHGDYDGRGYLSEKALSDFCGFVLETSEDQIDFMAHLLDLGELEVRIMAHAHLEEEKKVLPAGSAVLLRDILVRDEVPRGEVARILNVSARTATSAISELLKKGYVQSNSPKGALRLAFPGHACAFIFPHLYPVGGKNEPRP